MERSSRRALLERIDREIALAAALPGIAAPRRARASVAFEGVDAASDLRPRDLTRLADRRLHAIALVERARLAHAIEVDDEPAIEASARALIRSWAALAERTDYVEALARPALGSAADRAAQVALEVGVEHVTTILAQRARAGRDASGLLRALDEANAWPRLAERARRARHDAIDAVLDPIRRALDELATRRPAIEELCAAFATLRTAWQLCDRDVEVEILTVERLNDFAWDLYRDRELDALARFLSVVAEPAASLAARIERDGSSIAWAAPCAQVLVFRAEIAPRFDTQIMLAERAVAICPSLRNARVVLGDFLLTRAERAIDRGATSPNVDDDIARAASLHPELKRLPVLREKLARVGRRIS